MVTAWYDRWLKGLDTGVEEWPDVQVQDSTGRWRDEPGFPLSGGPAGQLALGRGRRRSATTRAPGGATTFSEDDEEGVTLHDRAARRAAAASPASPSPTCG